MVYNKHNTTELMEVTLNMPTMKTNDQKESPGLLVTSTFFRLVNIDVSSIVDTLSPLLFQHQ